MKISKVILTVAVLAFFTPQAVSAAAFRDIENLESLTFWEITGGLTVAYTFGVDGTQLMNRLATLNSTSYDFYGVKGHELYDVFYSDADGTFNIDGEYLTIEGVWDRQLPNGGGLNLAEMGLNFTSGTTEYGSYVASYVGLGDNFLPLTIPNAVDGSLATATVMGNTVGQTERLRLTLGFISSSGEEPAPVPVPPAFLLLGSGLIGLVGLRKRFS
jgi:hypothetical protein